MQVALVAGDLSRMEAVRQVNLSIRSRWMPAAGRTHHPVGGEDRYSRDRCVPALHGRN